MTHGSRLARLTGIAMGALVLSSGVAGATAQTGARTGPVANGTVTAVGGITTPGTCGTADASGEFTVTAVNTSHNPPTITSTNIDVTPTTSFVAHKVATVTFANVCVGDKAAIIGANTAGVITASAVVVQAPPAVKAEHDFGKVTAVNGVLITGTCGTAGATGAFTLATIVGGATVVKTVDVIPSTVFYEPKSAGATFADVCVGYSALAIGPNTAGTVAAGLVAIHVPKPPKPLHVVGTVTAVGGVTTAGTCGTTGVAGDFTVTHVDNATVPPSNVATPVHVSSTTGFFSKKVTATTFANVCVGAKAAVIGTDVSGTIDALAVAVTPAKT
jgi:hypothetical protein